MVCMSSDIVLLGNTLLFAGSILHFDEKGGLARLTAVWMSCTNAIKYRGVMMVQVDGARESWALVGIPRVDSKSIIYSC